ncbi:MAG: hypothetical protein M3Z31_11290 [Pseudomonadota bacterium]|nr:hypothetical protein [Pseudomonadota bacterium]
MQTTIMGSGQPPAVQAADPAMWVKSRQFTGGVVPVSNSRIFDGPIYNYTSDCPFHGEGSPSRVRIRTTGWPRNILLERRGANRGVHATHLQARHRLESRYFVHVADFEPRVVWRIIDLAGAYGALCGQLARRS